MAQWIKKPRTLRLLRTACSISSVRFVGQLTVVAGVVLKGKWYDMVSHAILSIILQ
jgi:hypothetical protein